MTIELIEHNSPGYEEMIALRTEVLLRPIGVPESYINRAKEAADVLIGAYENGQIIGCCVLTAVDPARVQLRQMAVHPRAQGKGVGAAIISFAESEARQRGFRRLIMHARDVVIPFYEKCGYAIEGEGFREVGIDHHMMAKALH